MRFYIRLQLIYFLGDYKEGYYIGVEVPEDHPQANKPFYGPNQWPSAGKLLKLCLFTLNPANEISLQKKKGGLASLKHYFIIVEWSILRWTKYRPMSMFDINNEFWHWVCLILIMNSDIRLWIVYLLFYFLKHGTLVDDYSSEALSIIILKSLQFFSPKIYYPDGGMSWSSIIRRHCKLSCSFFPIKNGSRLLHLYKIFWGSVSLRKCLFNIFNHR